MTKRTISKKSTDEKHIKKASLLRLLRKEAGLTQQQMAERVSISRETVVALENNYKITIETIESELQEKWWSVCRSKTSPAITKMWREFIHSCYNF